MKKDIVWKLDLFIRPSFKKEDILKLLAGVIVSQQVTRTASKKRDLIFQMLELDDEVIYNLDEEVVLVYDSDQEQEILDFELDIEPEPIVETFKRILMVKIVLSWKSRTIGFDAVDILVRIFLDQTPDPTIQLIYYIHKEKRCGIAMLLYVAGGIFGIILFYNSFLRAVLLIGLRCTGRVFVEKLTPPDIFISFGWYIALQIIKG